MKKLSPLILLALAAFLPAAEAATKKAAEDKRSDPDGRARVVVAPDGDDTNPGTEAAPFATLERAREAVKTLKTSLEPRQRAIHVLLRGGTYTRSEVFRLTAEDSGSAQAPVVYRSYPGEKARITGGRQVPLSKFTLVREAAVLERLPEAARGRAMQLKLSDAGITTFDPPPLSGMGMGFLAAKTRYKPGESAPELFVDGTPCVLARWPNDGYATVGRVVEQGDIIRHWMDDHRAHKNYVPQEKRTDPPRGFAFEGDRTKAARWTQARDMMLYGYWALNWADQAVEVEAVEGETGVLRSRQPSGYGVKKGQRYYVFNLLEELDVPGEWYCDRSRGILYLFPPEGAEGKAVEISLLTQTLVSLEDASFVRFEDIAFGVSLETLLSIKGGSENAVSRCAFVNGAANAIAISEGEGHRVSGCLVANMGAGGISVSGGEIKTLRPSGHWIENNIIRNYSRLERAYRPAIRVSGVGQIIRNNDISCAPHLAISFGGNNHLIELNHIHDVCRESDDASAIYAGRSWLSRGTIIRHNLFRDITGYTAGTHRVSGIYLDDGISGIEVSGNIFLNVAQGLLFNGGRDNRAEDNLFIGNANMMRGTDMSISFTTWASVSWLTLNEALKAAPLETDAWRNAYPTLATLAADEPQFPKYNTVRNNLRFETPLLLGSDGKNFATNGVADRYQKGIEENFIRFGTVENNPEIQVSPGRFDAVRGRFALEPASGVFQLMPGLKKIPVERIGTVQGRAGNELQR
jgi:hypothetical protein